MKAFLQNFGLMLAATLIALAGIEIGLRIWGHDALAGGNQNVFHRFDPVLGWANLPNARGQFNRLEFTYPVNINSIGMWDAEVTAKLDDEFRVAVLGDSFTWGLGAAYGERFTAVIEALNPAINALNFGVSGYAPIQYLLQIDDVLAFKPDYVIVVFCLGNDLTENVAPDPYGHSKPFAKLSPDESQLEIAGYPLQDTKKTGPVLIFGDSTFRIVGLIKWQLNRMEQNRVRKEATGFNPPYRIVSFIKRKLGIGDVEQWGTGDAGMGGGIFYIRDPLYAPSEKMHPVQQRLIASMYKVNDLLLDAIRTKVDAAIGSGRFAVLLAPGKLDIGMELPPGGNPRAIAERLQANLSRLGIASIDGVPALGPMDFWKDDTHWRPSGHRKIGELLVGHLSKVAAQARAARQ